MPTRPPAHQPAGPTAADNRRAYLRARGSPSARGYDALWRRFRADFLADNPLCADCLGAGRVAAATEVHHLAKLRDRPDLRLVRSNARGLCKPCHSARTARGE